MKISVPFIATAPTPFLLHNFWFCLLAHLYILNKTIRMTMELGSRSKITVAIRKIIEKFLSYEILLLRFKKIPCICFLLINEASSPLHKHPYVERWWRTKWLKYTENKEKGEDVINIIRIQMGLCLCVHQR